MVLLISVAATAEYTANTTTKQMHIVSELMCGLMAIWLVPVLERVCCCGRANERVNVYAYTYNLWPCREDMTHGGHGIWVWFVWFVMCVVTNNPYRSDIIEWITHTHAWHNVCLRRICTGLLCLEPWQRERGLVSGATARATAITCLTRTPRVRSSMRVICVRRVFT